MMRDGIVVGKCGSCGGVVSTPRVWYGVGRAPQQCESCGAYADEAAGLRTLPMRPPVRDALNRYLAPAQPEPQPRPAGPHDNNRDARTPVRE